MVSAAKNDLWLLGADFQRFCTELVELEATRKGEAKIESVSPGELELTVGSIDSLGHLAVWGKTGYHVLGTSDYYHSVEFGFEFDPSQLQRAVRNETIRSYAAQPTHATDQRTADAYRCSPLPPLSRQVRASSRSIARQPRL